MKAKAPRKKKVLDALNAHLTLRTTLEMGVLHGRFSSEINRLAQFTFRETNAMEEFVKQTDSPQHENVERDVSFLDALTLVRTWAQKERALTLDDVFSLQNTLLGAITPLRTTDAFAREGKHHYPMIPLLQERLKGAFDEAENGSVHAVIRAACIYYDIIFLHPFTDGNARAARLWFEFVLRKARITIPPIGYLVGYRKEAGDMNNFLGFISQIFYCLLQIYEQDERAILSVQRFERQREWLQNYDVEVSSKLERSIEKLLIQYWRPFAAISPSKNKEFQQLRNPIWLEINQLTDGALERAGLLSHHEFLEPQGFGTAFTQPDVRTACTESAALWRTAIDQMAMQEMVIYQYLDSYLTTKKTDNLRQFFHQTILHFAGYDGGWHHELLDVANAVAAILHRDYSQTIEELCSQIVYCHFHSWCTPSKKTVEQAANELTHVILCEDKSSQLKEGDR